MEVEPRAFIEIAVWLSARGEDIPSQLEHARAKLSASALPRPCDLRKMHSALRLR